MDRLRVEQLIDDSSWSKVLGWAEGLTGERHSMARRWYRSSLRVRAHKRAASDWRGAARVVQVGLALCFAETPEEASNNCAWGRGFAWTDEELAMPRLAALLAGRGRDWVEEFVTLATSIELRGDSWRGAGEITAIVSPAITAHDLAVPASGTFVLGWVQLVSSAHVASTAAYGRMWTPLRLSTVDGAGPPRPAYGLPTTLYEVLAATSKLPETLSSALATPDAFVAWNTVKGAGWEVDKAIARLIADGTLNRSTVIAECLAALTRADKPSAQRVMAAVLRGASFGAADVGAHQALVMHLMPSVHGSVTAVLLAAMLDTNPDEAVLLDVGTVILARREKAQKDRLVRYLSGLPSSETATTLLTLAAGDDDAAFAAKARAALPKSDCTACRGGTDEIVSKVPWQVPVTGRQPGPFVPWQPDAVGFDAARSDVDTWVRITTNAAWLDLVVRYAHRDLAGLREIVASGPEFPQWCASRVPPLLRQWCASGTAARSYTSHLQSYRLDPETGELIPRRTESVTTVPPGYVCFTDRLAEETLGRLGHVPELLSTPSYDDGTLTLDDLIRRVRALGRHGVAPYDLVQALLRLEPTVADDARRFDGLTAELTALPRRRSWLPRRHVIRDAVAVIRSWIDGGGLPARHIEVAAGQPRVAAAKLPLPADLSTLAGLDILCAEIADDRASRLWYGSGEVAHYLGVVPRWADSAVALLERSETPESVGRAQNLTFLTGAAGEFGVGVHHLLALLQGHPRQDCRLTLVEKMIEIARQDRLDAELLREQTLAAYVAGDLSLRRLAHTWEQVAQSGGLRWIWPAATDVLDAACQAARMPAGLADLLRALTPAIPTAIAQATRLGLPQSVHRLAGQTASTKAAVEARALVAATERKPL